MQRESLISVSEFCLYHRVDTTFVQTLAQQGLVSVITQQELVYIAPEQVGRLEKFVRLHQQLAIHPDDLDVVSNLLERVEDLQLQLSQLQNRLLFYEPPT